MDEIKATSIIKQTLPMLVLMGLGGTLAGLLLNAARNSLDLFPGLLVLVPAMQNLRGSISGSLASRLSTALHQGTVKPAPPERGAFSFILWLENDLKIAFGRQRFKKFTRSICRTVVHDDHFELDGQVFGSLSEAARHVTGARWNGWVFWGLAKRARKS